MTAEPKLYTKSMRATARKNAVTYDWAKEIVANVLQRADYLLEHIDDMCELVPSEGFPRAAGNSTLEAGERIKGKCPYCGISIAKAARKGQWDIDPTTKPWKISCPSCLSSFPFWLTL